MKNYNLILQHTWNYRGTSHKTITGIHSKN